MMRVRARPFEYSFEPRTSASGLRTSNAAQRPRRPVTAAQTALVRTATAGFPAKVGPGAAAPAPAAITPPPTTATSARPPLHNLRELEIRISEPL